MMIRTATQSDISEIQHLWEECFPDESGFNPYFFRNLFDPAQTALLIENERICAMTQMLPYTLRCARKALPATYIYGACTAPHARRRGLMSRLLEWTFARDREAGKAASILIPQEAWLFDFYKAYGYEPFFYLAQEELTRENVRSVPPGRLCRLGAQNIPALDGLYQTFMESRTGCFALRTPAQWQAQIALFHTLGLGAFGMLDDTGALAAYAFVWQEETGLWAQEFISRDEAAKNALASLLLGKSGSKTLKITAAGGSHALGCAKFYQPVKAGEGYINLMFN